MSAAATIVVYGLSDALAALRAAAEAAEPVCLRVAHPLTVALGPTAIALLRAEAETGVAATGSEWIVDCGADPGLVLSALRTGTPRVCATLPAPVRARLAGIAELQGAVLDDEEDALPALDLANARDAVAACRQWLALRRNGTADQPQAALSMSNPSCI